MSTKNKKLLVNAAIGIVMAAAVFAVSFFATKLPTYANGIVTEEYWAKQYPEIVASYEANAENDYSVEYLDEDPYLRNIYEGYGFAIQYGSAKGHSYCLEDVTDTARPHALANCLTCKTADYTKLVNDQGVSAYSLSFDEVRPSMMSNVGCYNCHANEVAKNGQLVVTHDYVIENLDAYAEIPAETLSCAQCHVEYYFAPDTKATSVPYSDIAGFDPAAMLEYYNSIDFADWTQESTGARLLKAQHPEFETFYGEGGKHANNPAASLTCADCHMAKEDGYTSHKLESPLENEKLLAKCAECHPGVDMTAFVPLVQKGVIARETEVGNALSELKDRLAEANQSGEYTEEELDAIRDNYRSAQWFFDFCYVENSEGAHNSTLAYNCLSTAEEYIAAANELFK